MTNVNLGGIQGAYAPQPSSPEIGAGNNSGGNFGDVLKGAVDGVEKADVSFQLMMQVRNKIVSAYQDIEKMQF